MVEEAVVELNVDVGYHLLTYLDGIDAINFIEAVNNSSQFWSIAQTSNNHFIELIKSFCGHSRILLLPQDVLGDFIDEYEIDNDNLNVVTRRYSDVIEPSERLYVHPCFSIEGFAKLCRVYQTPLFNCYCRLLPLNTVCYNADFGLLNYEWFGSTIGAERMLSDHEKQLFKVNYYFNTDRNKSSCSHLTFINTIDEFKYNLAVRFSSDTWLGAIDFSKWILVGGCVLNALCRSPFPDTKQQDVNFVYYVDDILDFKKSIEVIVNNLNKITLPDSMHKITLENIPGTPDYTVLLPCGVQLKFSWTTLWKSKSPLSHILHNFDMDICQVAFTGDKILSTLPFLQALATRSFIVYSLHARSPKYLCTRIAKYCNRGFDFLEPIGFDGNFDPLMAQEEIPLYRVENQHYINDDGEICIATKEFRRLYLDNIDTFRLQEKFINIVCPQLLQYR